MKVKPPFGSKLSSFIIAVKILSYADYQGYVEVLLTQLDKNSKLYLHSHHRTMLLHEVKPTPELNKTGLQQIWANEANYEEFTFSLPSRELCAKLPNNIEITKLSSSSYADIAIQLSNDAIVC